MKHRPPYNWDREASEADTAYQLAREQEGPLIVQEAPTWAFWVGIINAGIIIGLMGGLAWGTRGWLW